MKPALLIFPALLIALPVLANDNVIGVHQATDAQRAAAIQNLQAMGYNPQPAATSGNSQTSNIVNTLNSGLSTISNSASGGSNLSGNAGAISNLLGNSGNSLEKMTGSMEGLKGLSDTLGKGGDAIQGLFGMGGSAAGAGGAGGAGASGGGAAGGGGALVMDIGAILQSVLQLFQMQQQSDLLGNQLETLTGIKNINAEDLAYTQGVYGNIGEVPAFYEKNGGNIGQLQEMGQSFGSAGGSSGSGGTLGQVGGMSAALSAVGQLTQQKTSSLFNVADGLSSMWETAKGFGDDPVGTAMDLLSQLFGGKPQNRLASMSYEEMIAAGDSVPGALASGMNLGIMENAQAAMQDAQMAQQRQAKLAEMARGAGTLNEQAAAQSEIALEQNRQLVDSNAKLEQATQASAANAEYAAEIQRKQQLQNNATIILQNSPSW